MKVGRNEGNRPRLRVLPALMRPKGGKMNRERFKRIVDRRLNLTQRTLLKKQREYADKEEVFHNYIRAGEVCQVSKEKALQIMASKHLVSIADMIDSDRIFPIEYVEEKIGDAINYLILLEAMLKERHNGS